MCFPIFHQIYPWLALLSKIGIAVLSLLILNKIAIKFFGGGGNVKGSVVLMKKNVLDFTSIRASVLDRIHELLGRGVSLQLISADKSDPSDRHKKGKLGKVAYLQNWISTITSIVAKESEFNINFHWDESMGVPGAFIVKNDHHCEFFLKTVTLENVPGVGRVHFVCNSWIYPSKRYNHNRVFFSNQSYLTSRTPEPLRKYREEELANLRGTGTGELKEWDRVYDYAFYNDLGDPDKGEDFARPILGGNSKFPYPRRGRTGRKSTKKDPNYEKRLFLLRLDIYVPRDERFGHLKMSDFLAYSLKSIVQVLLPGIQSFTSTTPGEFRTFQDVLNLFEGGFHLKGIAGEKARNNIPLQMLKELVRTDGEEILKFPLPQVIKEEKFAWRTDEEFGREMLAGVNPVAIRLLQEFPPASKLATELYGNQTSTITKYDIEKNMEHRLTVDQALEDNRLFILDHHDTLIPYLNRINSTDTKIYAARTVLLLQDNGVLKPMAIELSLVHPDGEKFGCVSKVYTPPEPENEHSVDGSIWQLAKAYAAVNDSGVHQLISHWLNTHAVMEPFVIATNRQLSVLHPVHKLLHPHYRDTMNINALARQTLISADGVLERTVFPGKFAMELSAVVYKEWNFTDQALPVDLVKRGMAVKDQKGRLHLRIKDYPYAVDGLEIWKAIETWVHDYCIIYYPTDDLILNDAELQAWWEEVRTVGHGDLKDKLWWPKMHTLDDLTQTCSTIIWIASALHAAVNFGQYPYAGYLPNRPTVSRRFMPEEKDKEYAELTSNPNSVFLKTITSQLQTLLGVSLIEILSRHSSDEVYLGQRDTPEWTADAGVIEAFEKFGQELIAIENRIMDRNIDPNFRNRVGPVKMPYTLLIPNTSDYSRVGGLTGRGIPNSVSI